MELANLADKSYGFTLQKDKFRFIEFIFDMTPDSMLNVLKKFLLSTEGDNEYYNKMEATKMPVSRLVKLFTKPPPAEANPSSKDMRNGMVDRLAQNLDEDTATTADVTKFADYVFGLVKGELKKDEFIEKLTTTDSDDGGEAVRMKILKFLDISNEADLGLYFDLLSNGGQTVSREAFDSFVRDIKEKANARPGIASAPQADSTDIFDAIFGATPSSSASRRPERARGTVGGSAAVEDKSPSSGAPRSRVRRAREGR